MYLKCCASCKISGEVQTLLGWYPSSLAVFLLLASRSRHVCVSSLHFSLCCFHLQTLQSSSGRAVLWSDWLAPVSPPQLLIDLSEYVSLTSPAAPALAQTQRQPPKPPPASTRASAAELVSGQTDQLDRPVRSGILHVCLITNGGGETLNGCVWRFKSRIRGLKVVRNSQWQCTIYLLVLCLGLGNV